MKKHLLLIASFFFGIGVFAQFTEDNAPEIGSGTTLYVVDSAASSFSSIVGDNVTWDYSPYGGYNGDARNITVFDATITPNAGNFASSTEALDLESMIMSYTTTDATSKVSQGFVFFEPNLGEVIAQFDGAGETLFEYPFDFGNTINTNFSGSIVITFPMETTLPFNGTADIEVDGKGTLVLAENSYSDVLRYKLTESIIIEGVPFLGDLLMKRVQYEYYDHSVQNLPIFIHATIDISSYDEEGSGDPIFGSSVILSYENPTHPAGISTNLLENVTLFPNPVSNELQIQLPENVDKAKAVIVDALGREVMTSELNSMLTVLDVSSLKAGTYFVSISNQESVSVKTIIVK